MNHEHDVMSQLVDYHDHIAAPLVPLADDLRRGRRGVRRHRGLLAGGAALGVVSMIAVVSLSGGGRSADVPQPAHSPALTTPLVAPQSPLDVSELGFHIESAPDLSVTGDWAIDRDRQSVGVQVLGGDSSGMELQVEVYYEDVAVGYWTTVKFSGALPAKRINEILDKVIALQTAVKFAREEANNTEVVDQKVGAAVFGYLFG